MAEATATAADVVLDLGDTLYVGPALAADADADAEAVVRGALVRNGRPIPSRTRTDPFSAAVRAAWLAALPSAPARSLREWNDRTHEATARDVAVHPARRYLHRDDAAHSERPCGPDGRIGGPPDAAPIRRSLFDPQLGLIANLFNDLTSRRIATVGVEFRYAGTVVTSFGRGDTFPEAERVGILEMLERQAMHGVVGTKLRARYEPGDPGLLDPRRLLRHAEPAADDRVAYRDDDEIEWIRGVAFRSGEPVSVPLQAVELGHVHEPRYLFESSSGAALGASLSEARLFGLLELIERDAFLVFWAARVPLTPIDPATLPEPTRRLIASTVSDRRRVDVYDLTMDVPVPVVLCLIRDLDGPVHAYLSTAAHLDPAKAIELAVEEAVVGHGIYSTNPALAEEFPPDREVRDMFDHVRRGASRAFMDRYAFLDETPAIPYAEWAARYPAGTTTTADALIRGLVASLPAEEEVCFVDLTTDVAYSHGLYVAKAIVPGLLPMTFGHRHRRVNEDRVRRAIAASAYAERYAEEARSRGFDDDPHPYP